MVFLFTGNAKRLSRNGGAFFVGVPHGRLEACGTYRHELRLKYDTLEPKSAFVAAANEEGYDFTEPEFDEVLHESGDDFASFGNPRKRAIWWF